MKRSLIALCAASVIGLAVPLTAQSASTTADKKDSKDITITGCLEKNKSGGFWLTNARAGSEATGASSSTTASATTSTTTAGTSGVASTTDDKDVKRATAHGNWNLENGHDLDKYVNQTVQVTGRAKNDTSGDEVVGTTGHEKEARDFDVKSVSPIAASCR